MTKAIKPGVILLVEDEIDDIELFRLTFERLGVTNPVSFVCNGEEAVNYLSGNGAYADRELYPMPSIVLLDVRLPRLNGFEVLKFIRNQPALSQLTVVMLSGTDDLNHPEEAKRLGATAFLTKSPGRDLFRARFAELNACLLASSSLAATIQFAERHW